MSHYLSLNGFGRWFKRAEGQTSRILSILGHCVMSAKRFEEATKAYAQAAQLAPEACGYRRFHENALLFAQLQRKETR